jgi:peptidoglycan/xylan/chitin deacetylase (PgdA/CDA1 family)
MKRRAPAQLLFFWDYDTQWGGDRSRSPGGPKQWGQLEFENTERLLELHAEHNVPACFAVVGAAAERGQPPYHNPSQVRSLHAAGHEVASHAHRHEWLPGLDLPALRETVRRSKDAIEQCVGAPVITFVPPFNEPFDFARRGSISLSERREAPGARTDLPLLCAELGEAGYRFCRVVYKAAHERIADRLLGEGVGRPSREERIGGVTCVRLNTDGGFEDRTVALTEKCIARGGIAVVYGHPHSLHAGRSQDERHLVPFLRRLSQWRSQGTLRIALPRDLVGSV